MVVYRQYFQELKEGIIAPVYLLYGEEDYLIEEFIKRLYQLALGTGSRDFNWDYFDGEEADLEDIRAAVEMLPFGSPGDWWLLRIAPTLAGVRVPEGGRASGKNWWPFWRACRQLPAWFLPAGEVWTRG